MNDRSNTDEEIQKCIGYLLRELLIVEPKLVIACGSQVVYTLMGLSPLTKYIGKYYNHTFGFVIVPVVHPSAVLKSKSIWMRRHYNRGMAVVKKVIEKYNIES